MAVSSFKLPSLIGLSVFLLFRWSADVLLCRERLFRKKWPRLTVVFGSSERFLKLWFHRRRTGEKDLIWSVDNFHPYRPQAFYQFASWTRSIWEYRYIHSRYLKSYKIYFQGFVTVTCYLAERSSNFEGHLEVGLEPESFGSAVQCEFTTWATYTRVIGLVEARNTRRLVFPGWDCISWRTLLGSHKLRFLVHVKGRQKLVPTIPTEITFNQKICKNRS